MQVDLSYGCRFKFHSQSCMLIPPRAALQQKDDGYIVTVLRKLSECRHGDDDLENLQWPPHDASRPVLDPIARGYIIKELGALRLHWRRRALSLSSLTY